MSDEELVAHCAQGNAKAQQTLYDQYARKMFGVCLRYTATRTEAEDMLQEGFVKVFQSISSYKAFGPLENWIKKIIVNTALDYYRHRHTRVPETELFENAGEPIEPLQDYNAQELLKIIQQLPVGYRTVFNMHAIEGFNHREISEMLNITEGTSKSQYARARAQLVKVLNYTNAIAMENKPNNEQLIITT